MCEMIFFFFFCHGIKFFFTLLGSNSNFENGRTHVRIEMCINYNQMINSELMSNHAI